MKVMRRMIASAASLAVLSLIAVPSDGRISPTTTSEESGVHRHLANLPAIGTDDWWKDNYCTWYHPFAHCKCFLTKQGDFKSKFYDAQGVASDDLYVFVYPMNGDVVLKLDYMDFTSPGGCAGNPNVDCQWKEIEEGGLKVAEGTVGALHGKSPRLVERFRYSVEADADTQYRLSVFDVGELFYETCVATNGKGCFPCPHVQ